MSKDVGKLRDKAQAAVDKGKFKKAFEIYQKLETAQPGDGQWARRCADMHRRLGEDELAIRALGRAIDKYAEAGFVVKAVAMCKLVLQIRPEDQEAVARLATLQEKRGIPSYRQVQEPPPLPPTAQIKPVPAPGMIAPSPQGNTTESGAIELDIDDLEPEELPGLDAGAAAVEYTLEDTKAPRTIPPGAPLDAVALSRVLTDVKPELLADGCPSGITEIPLDLDLELVIVEDDEEQESVSAATQAAMALKESPLFAALSKDGLQELALRAELVELSQGEYLFHQGDLGQTLYVVSEGEVAVLAKGSPEVELSRLQEGEFFGEIAVVTEQPRNASIRAIQPSELIAIDRTILGDLLDREPQLLRLLLRFLRDRLLDTLMNTSPLFAPFSGDDREALVEKFRFLEVEPESILVSQDDATRGLYVMLSGQAKVTRTRDGEQEYLATLSSGDVFGEMSLLANEPAIANVICTSRSFALELPRDAFRQTIMTHPHVLEVVGDLADQRKKQFVGVQTGEVQYEELSLDLL